MKKIITSESVTIGHPDKICDRISDTILDEFLKQDKESKVACETCISNNLIVVFGEITSKGIVDIKKTVINTIKDIGYNKNNGFDTDKCKIIININKQSEDIALGLKDKDIGAGDQGIMYGYACNETDTYMPLPIYLAHKLSKRLEYVRTNNIISNLRPDGKTQVSVEYENNIPKRIHTIIVSIQHDSNIINLKKNIIKHVIYHEITNLIDKDTIILINPTGNFVIGGPEGDSGLTGRKIIVDTYGGYSKHGGGAFSGKDYTKVDRTASYYARYVAKNIVASGLAGKCEIGVSYAIGISNPISIFIDTFNTSIIKEEELLKIIKKEFDFRPLSMIKKLDMKNIEYKIYSSYGHFGRTDVNAPWENLNKISILKKYVNVKHNN